uniref:Uncharacterized conserved protein, contains Mth938-like domain n=1 Tax=Candidatus Kentrum sp. TUN TaxID=2126343 RepID=A0A450ZGV1_9GAMM|nr:MAG: Uncharacterized conserved protein, contains Mth938-like domain [Candidatus Kentron sp. TUN]VFK52560.1 MAG: Uncharacterized conserved protein, contains Mth938-like domain [Candidatus Kentron sp. TUN]VFK53043.1 MAG: Uncharacterized conserved protein, contains Mth938-like domain [Candidatus Kentron sp. TUN]
MSVQSISLQVDDSPGVHRVTAYGETDNEGYVAVDGQMFTHSLILTPSKIMAWPPRTFAEVTPEHVGLLMEPVPEVVLFGSGREQHFPAHVLFRVCYERGIGVETMTTAAACRTYNLLVNEGRVVTAALLMPSR